MRIAITGGTGFVGRHLAQRLVEDGHEVTALGRRGGSRPAGLPPQVTVLGVDLHDHEALTAALRGCSAVAHCAGINREIGSQTYASVHVEGTRAVVQAARAAGVERIVMLSFLRARPDGPSEYHRSKWDAEELVRVSGLTWTVLKAGVIHGRGDHMLDHLSRAFYTFPVFGLVGLRERPVRPVAVDDVARVLEAAVTGDPRLAAGTMAGAGTRAHAPRAGRSPRGARHGPPAPLHPSADRGAARDRAGRRARDAHPVDLAGTGADPPGRRGRAGTRRGPAARRPGTHDTLFRCGHPRRVARARRLWLVRFAVVLEGRARGVTVRGSCVSGSPPPNRRSAALRSAFWPRSPGPRAAGWPP